MVKSIKMQKNWTVRDSQSFMYVGYGEGLLLSNWGGLNEIGMYYLNYEQIRDIRKRKVRNDVGVWKVKKI